MKLSQSIFLLICGITVSAFSTEKDAFTATKQKLSAAKCMQLSFRSFVHSSVFETVDTLDGNACIAADGRYRIQLGNDEYLFDGTTLYSYSKENNQVTIQKSDSGASADNEILLLTRLDELYESSVISPNERYNLRKKESQSTANMPDSVLMTIDPEKMTVKRLEYKNENGDQTSIDIRDQKLLPSCEQQKFLPHYANSVERIKL